MFFIRLYREAKKSLALQANHIKSRISDNDYFISLLKALGALDKRKLCSLVVILIGAVTIWQARPVPSDRKPLVEAPGEAIGSEEQLQKDHRPQQATVSRGNLSPSDRYLLARVIEGEAADEPLVGKVAVGAVVINRTESHQFPREIKQVVYQPLAFEAVMNGQYNRPLTGESLRAADLAISGWDPTSGSLYYWNPVTAKSKWVWQRPITMKIGRHVFAN